MKYSSGIFMFSVALIFNNSAIAAENIVTVSEEATYYDENIIASNIRKECTKMGQILSSSTKHKTGVRSQFSLI